MVKKPKIRIKVEGTDVSWMRGWDGMSVREFSDQYPCLAIAYLQETMGVTAMGQALISEILRVNQSLEEWAKNTQCPNVDFGMIQQI